MTQITPRPGIMDIALYVSGESRLAGRDTVLKLSSNENPLGCSDAARAAYAAAADDLHRYPNTDHAPLRRAIGEVHGLDPDRIICGVGSDEVLQFVVHAFAGAGDEVITTEHGFSMYPILARMVGATPVTVPETERRIDIDAILGRVDLIGLAEEIIDGVDLPDIIREASTSVTADVMTDVRSTSERADDAVANAVNRFLRRRGAAAIEAAPDEEGPR